MKTLILLFAAGWVAYAQTPPLRSANLERYKLLWCDPGPSAAVTDANTSSGQQFNKICYVDPNVMIPGTLVRFSGAIQISTEAAPNNFQLVMRWGNTAFYATPQWATPAASLVNRTFTFDCIVQGLSNPGASVNLEGSCAIGDERLFTRQYSGAIDFTSISATTCASNTFTATGLTAGTPIIPVWPATLDAALVGNMWATADAVNVKLCNISAAPVDPASVTFAASSAQSTTGSFSLANGIAQPTTGAITNDWVNLNVVVIYNGTAGSGGDSMTLRTLAAGVL